jgi:hypothetical protein
MAGKPQDLARRFWSKVNKLPSGCWEWTACLNEHGYGMFSYLGRAVRAHNIALMLSGVEIPKGLEPDHICRNTKCIRPDHLEAVTHLENGQRSMWAMKLHCANGHLMVGENIYWHLNRGRRVRNCLICKRDSGRRHHENKRKADSCATD